MKNKFIRFMQGRYGIDHLYMFLFYSIIFIMLINIFANSFILYVFELIIMIFMFYRVFSKNIYQRQIEETKYLNIKGKILNMFKKSNIKKDKEHVYKKCKNCKTMIRLPLPPEIGFKSVTCPKCKHKMKILVLKKQKIEVIRKK